MNRFIPLALAGVSAAAGAQKLPEVRPLGAVVATSPTPFSNVNAVRQLPAGRVLVNDVLGRKVVLLDSSLATLGIVADSTPATGTAFSGRLAGLVPYRGDSTLFVDPQSLSMLMIDPTGKIARVLSVPRAEDAMSLAGGQGMPGLDPQGRLIYRGALTFTRPPRMEGGAFQPPVPPESLAIVRTDLGTRVTDTLGFVKVPKMRMNMTRTESGGMNVTTEINPLPQVDEWAVTSNGALAIVRGQDYHIDWVAPDGTKSSTPKIPFEWQRLTDEDKVAFIDSVKAIRARQLAAAPAGAAGGSTVVVGGPPPGGSGGGGGGEQRITMTMAAPGGGGGGGPAMMGGNRQLNFVPPSELPDYKPPFFNGAVRADADGNIWVRTIPTKARPGGIVYDVINGKGELVDRVQVPMNRTIIGFGPGGIVYLALREPQAVTMTIEKARVK